jgi:hypothetical protein
MVRIKEWFPAARGVWQLGWRSVVFLPLALVLSTLWLAYWIGVWVLPMLAVIFALRGEWLKTAGAVAVWVPLVLISRWKRLRIDAKDRLNEQENV